MGYSDNCVKKYGDGGRVEVFEIAEDEQLIGCEINEWIDGDLAFTGVTWIKIKLTD